MSGWRIYNQFSVDEIPCVGDIVKIGNDDPNAFDSCIITKINRDGTFDVARAHVFMTQLCDNGGRVGGYHEQKRLYPCGKDYSSNAYQ